MRENQRGAYAQRIERAVSHIESAAAAGHVPDLAELASVAALSDYHFHRIFRLMTGETPAAAVTRIRLAASLPALEQGDIGDATDLAGYATTQAYGRALKAASGATPSALRDDAAVRAQVAAALANPEQAAAGQAPALTIAVASFAPLRLLTLRNVGDYAELNSGYGALFELVMAQLLPERIAGIYGLPDDDPRFVPASACRFTCGLATGDAGSADPAAGLDVLHLPGWQALRLDLTGDFDGIHGEIDQLYAWAIAHDWSLANAPLVIHYLDDPEEVPPEDQRAQVWLMLDAEDAV